MYVICVMVVQKSFISINSKYIVQPVIHDVINYVNGLQEKMLWHALAKMLSEKAAWALAMDRKLNMVSINLGLIIGPSVAQHNPRPTMSYLKGAAQMYENGVLAYVDIDFVADVHIRAFEDVSACGRYFCFNKIVNTEQEALKLVVKLSPLIPMPPRYENLMQGSEVYEEKVEKQ
ncbi:unnamed protein product [Cochlearia groenlandica]